MFNAASGMKTAIRQVQRWLVAAQQDQHPFVAILHANYAVGNIDLMRQLWSDQEILTTTGVNINTLAKDAAAIQDRVTATMG